jgi:excisionase family DNA binding protein
MTSLLTAEEVAERLGVTKDWVWAQARAGRIPHVRLGRYCRFREEAIEAWVLQLEATVDPPLRHGRAVRARGVMDPQG